MVTSNLVVFIKITLFFYHKNYDDSHQLLRILHIHISKPNVAIIVDDE